MARYVFKLPDVGEGTVEAEISQWHVAVGDRIEEDQPLVDVTTDKAIVEIPAPASGTVASIHGAVGEKVIVGAELVVIETDALPEPRVEEKAEQASETEPRSESAPAMSKGLAAPAVRQRARTLGIELQSLAGSGPAGRVTHADLDSVLQAARRDVLQVTRHAAASAQDVVEEHRVVGIRRKIAERMQEAKRRIPHYSYVEEVDVTALEKLRARLNEEHGDRRVKLTPLAFVIRAVVRAVAKHPELNARFDDEKGIVNRHAAMHVGIATQTPHGLLVPVVMNAQARDLWDCAAEMNRLAVLAREGRATRTELSGSTITITSLGPLGGIATTPIINYPEVAIVGMNKIEERPVARESQVVLRRMMNLSASFDHRVVDGWNAAAFIQDVKRLLEEPAMLFVE